jgi:hypothetical protein
MRVPLLFGGDRETPTEGWCSDGHGLSGRESRYGASVSAWNLRVLTIVRGSRLTWLRRPPLVVLAIDAFPVSILLSALDYTYL